jgi:hypothetical protein
MALRSTDSLIIEVDAGDLTPSLPDPATVSGRTHDLTSTATSAAVWGSTGATPFQVDGVNVASLTVPRGSVQRVQSDGVRWVAIKPAGVRRVVAAKGVTDSSGNVTFNFSPAFATVPVVAHSLESSSTSTTEARITAVSASSVTFNARGSAIVVVLSINVLGAPVPLAGATIHMLAIEAG